MRHSMIKNSGIQTSGVRVSAASAGVRNFVPASKVQTSAREVVYLFRPKDPGSAFTHLIGFLLALLAAFPILIRAAVARVSVAGLVSVSIFMLSMLLLYGASTVYHSFNLPGNGNRYLKKLDHMMIFVLIAGTYTPLCVLKLPGHVGFWMLVAVWSVAVLGMILKACWITCPKWFSSVLYIAMGWICIGALPQIIAALTGLQFLWLLTGGILYTIGGIIYALKLSVFNELHKNFGSHEIFHVFVMAGSFCHYMCIYSFLGNL